MGRVSCDFIINRGMEFTHWIGINVFGLEYNEADNAFVGEIDGEKTVAFLNCNQYKEEEEISDKDSSYKRYRILNKIDKKYEKYVGYNCIEISCNTNKDADWYTFCAYYQGKINSDRTFTDVDLDKLNAYDKMFYSRMYNADINYNKQTEPYRMWRGSDADDCIAAFEYFKKM